MVKVKLSRIERIAGLFVAGTLVGCLMITVVMAVKKGWFESTVTYFAEVPTADGLHSGTDVQMSGLRIGAVDEVAFDRGNRVKIRFHIKQKYQEQIRSDSQLTVLRPFVIGEKVLDISVGTEQAEVLKEGSAVQVASSYDFMDVFSGKKLGPFLGLLEGMSANVKVLADALSKTERSENLIKLLDLTLPLVQNMNAMAAETVKTLKPLNRDKQVEVLLGQVVSLSQQLNKVLPTITENTPQLVQSLVALTKTFEQLIPALNVIAPELPTASKRALQALDETVVTLKALQKSFLLRGNVKEVREEERKPASETADEKSK